MLADLEKSLKDHTEKGLKLSSMIDDLGITLDNLKKAHPVYDAIQKLNRMWLDLNEVEKRTMEIVSLLEKKIEDIKGEAK